MPTYIKELPTKEELEERFYEEGGRILWKPKTISRGRKSIRAGRPINTYEDDAGYLRGVICKSSYPLSRLVYQINFGDLTPEYEIDHIDRNKRNNRIENLRKVLQGTNKRNKPHQINGSRACGVCLNKKKWSGGILEYWVARWYDLEGVLRGKHFRIDTLGNDEAFRLACEYRARMIAELNEQGAGYTETHGT